MKKPRYNLGHTTNQKLIIKLTKAARKANVHRIKLTEKIIEEYFAKE